PCRILERSAPAASVLRLPSRPTLLATQNAVDLFLGNQNPSPERHTAHRPVPNPSPAGQFAHTNQAAQLLNGVRFPWQLLFLGLVLHRASIEFFSRQHRCTQAKIGNHESQPNPWISRKKTTFHVNEKAGSALEAPRHRCGRL